RHKQLLCIVLVSFLKIVVNVLCQSFDELFGNLFQVFLLGESLGQHISDLVSVQEVERNLFKVVVVVPVAGVSLASLVLLLNGFYFNFPALSIATSSTSTAFLALLSRLRCIRVFGPLVVASG